MLLPSGNPLKCHEEVLYLQPMIPPKRFDILPPDWGMLSRSVRGFGSEASNAFRSVAKNLYISLLKDITERKQEKEGRRREVKETVSTSSKGSA